MGFTTRVSFGDAVKLLIGEKEAAVAMQAQLCVEFREYDEYFAEFADALVTDDVVRVEHPPEMTGLAGGSGSYAAVARRAYADKFSGDKKAGRREDGVELTLGPFPDGTKWFQVKGLLVFSNAAPSHVHLAVNPNGTMIAYGSVLDLCVIH